MFLGILRRRTRVCLALELDQRSSQSQSAQGVADGGRSAGAHNKYRGRTRFKSTRARDINLPVALCGEAPECLSLVRRPRRAGRCRWEDAVMKIITIEL